MKIDDIFHRSKSCFAFLRRQDIFYKEDGVELLHHSFTGYPMPKPLLFLLFFLLLTACPEEPETENKEKDPPKENQVEATTDAGSSDGTIENPTSDAGNGSVAVTDGGNETTVTSDAGTSTTAETDGGNETTTSLDAGTHNTTAPDAGIIIAECVEGNAQLGTTSCGNEGLGFYAHLCTNGQWQESTRVGPATKISP